MPTAELSPSFASDVWGIGATLFHAAAAYRPFPKGVRDEAAPASSQWPQLVEAPYELPRFVPDVVGKLIYACLDRDPAQRPTPSELAELVSPVMDALPKPRLSGFKISAT